MSLLNFKDQIKGLTKLKIAVLGTNPIDSEVTQFLRDGVIDVVTTVIKLDPSQKILFVIEKLIGSTRDIIINSGEVVEVFRADGVSADNLYSASQISFGDRYVATDSTSLKYRSKLNPGWYLQGKKLKIIPDPSNVTTNSAKVYYIDWDSYEVDLKDYSIGTSVHEVQTNVSAATTGIFTTNDSGGSAQVHTFVIGDKVELTDFTDSGKATDVSDLNGITAKIISENFSQASGTFRLQNVSVSTVATDGVVENVKPEFPKRYERLVVIYAAIRSINNYLASFTILSLYDNPNILLPDSLPVPPKAPDLNLGGSTLDWDFGIPDLGFTFSDIDHTFPHDPPVLKSPKIGTQDLLDNSSLLEMSGEFVENFWLQLRNFIEEEEDEELADISISKIKALINAYSEDLKNKTAVFNSAYNVWEKKLAAFGKELDGLVITLEKKADMTLAAYAQGAANKVKTYTAQVQSYVADVNNFASSMQVGVAAFEAELNKAGAEYKWMTERMVELKNEYNGAFAKIGPLRAPKQQQGQQQSRQRRAR